MALPPEFDGDQRRGRGDEADAEDQEGEVEVGGERAGGSERNLVHVGALTFHPVGAETVRIAFAGEGTGRLTVTDGPFSLTATRGQMENGKW